MSNLATSRNKGTRHARNLALLVRAEIEATLVSGAGPPTLSGIASGLRLNTRTMQRQLSEEGVDFRTLLDNCRRRHATNALAAGQRSVAKIATRLGYSDPAHFARAFRRWTGNTPTAYRQAMTQRRLPVEGR